MSILAMIAAMQTHAGPPAPPADPRPAPLDATVEAMRPTGRVIFTATVARDGSGGYSTISGAIAAARTAQADRMAAEGVTTATPNYATRLIIGPGEYREPVAVGSVPWVQLYGAGSDRTIILPPGDGTAHRGVLESAGRLYVEGLTLRRDVSNADKTLPVYPVHTNNKGTSIYADVFFDNALEPGGFAFGSDGSPDGATYLYRCRLTGGMNAHGWADMNAEQRMSIISTTATGQVGWTTMNDTSPADVWIVGGTSGSIKAYGASARLHLDPAHVTSGTITAPGPRDADTRWPIPFGGLSPWDAALYGMGDPDATAPVGTPGY